MRGECECQKKSRRGETDMKRHTLFSCASDWPLKLIVTFHPVFIPLLTDSFKFSVRPQMIQWLINKSSLCCTTPALLLQPLICRHVQKSPDFKDGPTVGMHIHSDALHWHSRPKLSSFMHRVTH